MEELAEECKSDGKEVYFIDTFSLTEGIYNRLGEVATEKLHAVIGKGADAKLDDTHYSPCGAGTDMATYWTAVKRTWNFMSFRY